MMIINKNISVNFEKLHDIIKTLHVLTKMQIGVLDSDGSVVFGYPTDMNPFCLKINYAFGDSELCAQCDRLGVENCNKKLAAHSYFCHAGLNETVVPILYEKKIYLYLLFGQYINIDYMEEHMLAVQQYLNKKGRTFDVVESDFNNLTRVDTQQIDALVKISSLCIQSLWQNQIFEIPKKEHFIEVENYIRNNIASKLTINQMCKKLSLSKKTLYSLFYIYCGTTVKKYITQKRIDEAKKLLISSNKSLQEICDEIGMDNYNNFIQTFKKIEKITPHQFRKRNANI